MYIDHKVFDAALNTTTRAPFPALMNKLLFMVVITPIPLALLWQSWLIGGRQLLMTMWALRLRRSCQPVEDRLPDGWRGRLRGRSTDFFSSRSLEAAGLQEGVGEHRHQGMSM